MGQKNWAFSNFGANFEVKVFNPDLIFEFRCEFNFIFIYHHHVYINQSTEIWWEAVSQKSVVSICSRNITRESTSPKNYLNRLWIVQDFRVSQEKWFLEWTRSITSAGWFFLLVRPKKWQSVRLHVNSFKKVLSVRIS